MRPPPPAAAEHHRLSAALAARGAAQASRARVRGAVNVAQVVIRYQAAGAALAQRGVTAMLTQQAIDVRAEALLNSLAFTTETNRLLGMVEAASAPEADDSAFDRLVASLIQDSTRAAETVAVAARPGVVFVRFLNLPSCGRCAVLAGRVYRYSTGFQRHVNCDCSMLPTTVAAPDFVHDPTQLALEGQIRGLSRADVRALNDGADLGRVVNVRQRAAGLREAGQVLARNGKPTPVGIYRTARDQAEAIALLRRFGYLL